MIVDEAVRRGFAGWLREHRDELLGDPGDGTGRWPDCRSRLGLDDDTLRAFADAERVIVTLPHASPNVFFPRARVSWYARHLQDADDSAFHLRLALGHVNFSDLGWRPYAWWYLDTAGRLARETLFTRNKKAKHVVVASRPPIESVPDGAGAVDAEAAELARFGRDRAVSHLLIMATVERAAGFTPPGRCLYLPLEEVLGYFLHHETHDAARAWVDALTAHAEGRRLAPDGRLVPADDPADAFVLDNDANIALLSLLSCTGMIGGAKMAGYWPRIDELIDRVSAKSGAAVRVPELVRLPDGPDEGGLRPSPALADALAEAGVRYSQGLAVAEHGRFADHLDPFG